MKKMMFKKLLSILDMIEIHGILEKNLKAAISKELHKEAMYYKDVDLDTCISYLYSHHFLKNTKRGADLSPCATIFAKADSNSRIEALSIFECCYQSENYRSVFSSLTNTPIHRVDLYSYFDEISYSLLTQTSLFFEKDDFVSLRKEYIEDILAIMKEYENGYPLLSVTLCARYTSSIVAHEDVSIEYKNRSNVMVPYKDVGTIIKIIPRRGVPCDRNETKALQTFYKDTLFHECEHACPICEIDIAHMLIASHIKPFRDCAHIYEAIDHNNGLLLCRNHDYLFDQGYISFDDDGKLLISKQLRMRGNLHAYVLHEDFYLPYVLMSEERRLFLNYHRLNIYKG